MDVVIAAHYPVIRLGLKTLIQDIGAGSEIDEVSTYQELLDLLSDRGSAALILLDLSLPHMTGLAGLRALRKRHPTVPIVLVAGSTNRKQVTSAVRLGIKGFISRSGPCDDVVRCVELVLGGNEFFPWAVLGEENAGVVADKADLEDRDGFALLSQRQRAVATLLADGRSNSEIAESLGLSNQTVRHHVSSILRALNVGSRTQAALRVANLMEDEI